MKTIAQGNSWKVCSLFLGAQGLVPLASIVLYQHHYHYPLRVVGYHMLCVATGYLALLAAMCLLCSIRPVRARAASRYALPLAWGSLTVALYYAYLLAWVGRLNLGANLTPGLVAPYLRQPLVTAKTLNISPAVFWGVVTGVPVAMLLTYAAAALSFSAVLLRLRARMRRASRTPLPPTRQGGVVCAACVLIAMVSTFFLRWPPSSMTALCGDPIFVTMNHAQEGNNLLPLTDLGVSSDSARVAYVAPGQFQKKNVILIVMDACRADHLSVMGYGRDTTPFLDSLHRTGHLRLVRSFYSASCCSFGGILSLLRSQHWYKMTRRAFALPDVLKKAGYRVQFVLSGDHTHFMNMRYFYGDSLDMFSDGLNPTRHYGVNDDRGVMETLDHISPYDGVPSFFYFHLMSIHALGPRLPSNTRYQPATSRSDLIPYCNNYDNGIVQADNDIRELFGQLERKGYLRNSLVVITGDHGESLGERGKYGHAMNLYAEEINPPLMIYDPDPVTYRNLDFARQIDVAPTILDRLGLPIPPTWDGHSLLRDEMERFSYLRLADSYGVIDRTSAHTLKYIYDSSHKTEEIYDETCDPRDQHNLIQSTEPQEVHDLRDAVGAFAVHPGA